MESERPLPFSQDSPFDPTYRMVNPVQILTLCYLTSPLVSPSKLRSAFPTIFLKVSFGQKLCTRFSFTPFMLHVMVKVKQSHYRPGVDQRVPGS